MFNRPNFNQYVRQSQQQQTPQPQHSQSQGQAFSSAASPAPTNVSSVSGSSDQDYIKISKSDFTMMMGIFCEFMHQRKEDCQSES